jgi:hypothetical protein
VACRSILPARAALVPVLFWVIISESLFRFWKILLALPRREDFCLIWHYLK